MAFVSTPSTSNNDDVSTVFGVSTTSPQEPVKENNDAPLIEDWESKGEDEVESPLDIERKTIKPSVDNAEVDIPKQNDKNARRLVKYAEMYITQRPRGSFTQAVRRPRISIEKTISMVEFDIGQEDDKFWRTASAKTLNNGEIELNATVDGQDKTITEASVRRHLKLADADVISTLPTTKILEQLTLIGLKKTQKRTKSDQNRTKREAWQSREKSEAVTVDRARKTEQNAKRRARGEAEKSQKQLQWIEEEKLNKMQKEGPEMQSLPKL
nr:hypothetical protein [Tanacetum cinerariifolium]